MSAAPRALSIALLLLLAGAATADQDGWDTELADCQPDRLTSTNNTWVTLQMHQWIWIQNLTALDWMPRSHSGPFYYEILKPGFVMNQTVGLLTLRSVAVNVSFVTNGESLCAAVLTENINRTTGNASRVCSRMCFHNFTSTKTRLNLPLLVFDDWTTMTRYNEYLAFDAVDPDAMAVYTCLGYFAERQMETLPSLMSRAINCSAGDVCLFNYDNRTGLVNAGCQKNFTYSWCTSDMDSCTFNIYGECPICCRGDLCNKQVAEKGYQRWLAGQPTTPAPITTTPAPITTTKTASSVASSLRMLGTGLVGLFIVNWRFF